ncbi:MAG: ROK family protein [Bacteroidota bacterium]|nr:ROK family protein [Bacteroidota bacterium]|tara:strand:- start:1241 stop:2131 length:891 start_codon:yes stop_codon:yes gene_type:complete
MLLGIDLGGTKIEGIVLESKEKPIEVIRHRVDTEEKKGYLQVVDNIKSLVEYIENKINHKFDKLGIGTPGTLDPATGLLKNSNSQCLNGMPLKKDLSKTLDKTILIQNDANCFALAETLLGSVNDQYPHAKNVFGIIIGTGVGGGVIINGKTVYGSQGIGGEWGHTIVTDNGDECYCGKRGCVETVISGRALQTYYKNISGRKLKFEEIYATKDNDKYAKETFERLITYFGKGLSNVVNIIDPEVIVLGGGLSNINELYTEGYNELKKYVFNPTFSTPILKPKLGDSAGVYGAALL